MNQRRPVVKPIAQLALKVGVGLLQRQALPVGHSGPFSNQLDRGQLDECANCGACALGVVTPHIELHTITANAPGQVQALTTVGDDDFVRRVQPGNQGA